MTFEELSKELHGKSFNPSFEILAGTHCITVIELMNVSILLLRFRFKKVAVFNDTMRGFNPSFEILATCGWGAASAASAPVSILLLRFLLQNRSVLEPPRVGFQSFS